MPFTLIGRSRHHEPKTPRPSLHQDTNCLAVPCVPSVQPHFTPLMNAFPVHSGTLVLPQHTSFITHVSPEISAHFLSVLVCSGVHAHGSANSHTVISECAVVLTWLCFDTFRLFFFFFSFSLKNIPGFEVLVSDLHYHNY